MRNGHLLHVWLPNMTVQLVVATLPAVARHFQPYILQSLEYKKVETRN